MMSLLLMKVGELEPHPIEAVVFREEFQMEKILFFVWHSSQLQRLVNSKIQSPQQVRRQPFVVKVGMIRAFFRGRYQ
jgi:hypothetical protein